MGCTTERHAAAWEQMVPPSSKDNRKVLSCLIRRRLIGELKTTAAAMLYNTVTTKTDLKSH